LPTALLQGLIASNEVLCQKIVVRRSLGRSPETIRTQLRKIFKKLDIKNVVLLAHHMALRE